MFKKRKGVLKRFTNKGKKCLFEGCDHMARSKGYCVNHYQYIREHEKTNGIEII